jgi:hypothetical protein
MDVNVLVSEAVRRCLDPSIGSLKEAILPVIEQALGSRMEKRAVPAGVDCCSCCEFLCSKDCRCHG